jgi:hypothetical protein
LVKHRECCLRLCLQLPHSGTLNGIVHDEERRAGVNRLTLRDENLCDSPRDSG